MRSFEKFVDSPYFNTSEATAKLFKEIRKFYPGFDDENFTKEYLFEKVYGDKQYSESLLRKIISNLIKLTGDFLKIHNKFDSAEFELNLLREYSKRPLLNLFEKRTGELITGMNRNKSLSVDSMEFFSKIEQLKSDTYYTNELIEKSINAYQNYTEYYLPTVFINLLQSAIQLKIDSNYSHKLPNNQLSEFVDSINWEKILKLIKPEGNKFLTELYVRMYHLYNNQSDHNNFIKLKEMILKDNNIIDTKLLSTILVNLESYCIIKYDSDKDYSMINHITKIYEFTLSKNLFDRSAKGFMPIITYRNYLIIFLIKRIDLAEKLLNEYINDIDPEIRKNVKEYSEMFIYFKKKKYEKALLHLNRVELPYSVFKYDIKAFLIKIHFELGNYEQVLSAVDAYKHFLKDENKSERFTLEIKEFLNCIPMLIKAVCRNNIDELEHLKYILDKKKISYEYNWIIEKIDQHLKSLKT
jgi:hypothetical protein